jgi:hypothetical protein
MPSLEIQVDHAIAIGSLMFRTKGTHLFFSVRKTATAVCWQPVPSHIPHMNRRKLGQCEVEMKKSCRIIGYEIVTFIGNISSSDFGIGEFGDRIGSGTRWPARRHVCFRYGVEDSAKSEGEIDRHRHGSAGSCNQAR